MKIFNIIICRRDAGDYPICPSCGEQKIVFGHTIKPNETQDMLELFCAKSSCNFNVKLNKLKTPVVKV